MINSAYELNYLIPNIELLFYKIFCSPISTLEERQGNDKEDLLVGNIFAKKKVGLTYFGYKSLLETLVLEPKKKHFKKVIAHLEQFEQREEISEDIINLIVQIGISAKWPVQLGKAMKFFISNDYNINTKVFQDFVLFLERCKGYEEDAKRFILLTNDTQCLEFSYKLIRPLFLRSLLTKSGNEVLKLFEQFRKNLRLNRTQKKASEEEKQALLKEKKKEFYDGILQDMLE